jgi:hypothetical protein
VDDSGNRGVRFFGFPLQSGFNLFCCPDGYCFILHGYNVHLTHILIIGREIAMAKTKPITGFTQLPPPPPPKAKKKGKGK